MATVLEKHDVIPMASIGGVKCPRCYQWHLVQENYDNLCDRCCRVILEDYPNFEAAPKIREAYDAQRTKYGIQG